MLTAVYYRPPGQSADMRDLFLEQFSASVSQAIESNPTVLAITGDFNDRCLEWDSEHSDSELGTRLLNIVSQNNLFQLINEPTRSTEYTNSLLDLIITDSPGLVLDSGTLPPISNSDHAVIYAKLALSFPRERSFYRRIWKFKNANFIDLNECLSSAPWDTGFLTFDDINDITSFWFDLFVDTLKTFIPNRDVLIRPKDKPWMNTEIKILRRKRHRAWKRFKRSGNMNHFQIFKRLRNDGVDANRKAIRDYFCKLREEIDSRDINPKRWWSLTKSILGCKVHQSIPPLIENDSVVSNLIEKAEIFNKYFASQNRLPVEENPQPLPDLRLVTEARLDLFSFSETDVEKVLSALRSSSATGPDGVGNTLLKNTAKSISKSLCKLFNLSLSSGKFPSVWKKSNICPIYKKGDRQTKSNYRPVSLLCNVSKVLERLVFNRFYEYLVANNLLTPKNSGFKVNDSTINQLISIVHQIYNGLECKHEVRMVFLDVSKAFDKVWHEGLLFKLRQLGFCDELVAWVGDYLSNRYTRVTIHGQSSSWLPIEAGVPQGSILGPLLFLVYVNDIVNGITVDIRLFADDTSFLEIVKNPTVSSIKLNSNLSQVGTWGKNWKVTFNGLKSLSVIFSAKRNKPDHDPLFLDGVEIPEGTSHTHLGITLSSNLSWKDHIVRVTDKACKRVALLKRFKYRLSRNALSKLYKSMIRPILEYGCILFDNCTQELSKLLESVQYEAARICTGALRHTDRFRLLAELGWETLAIRRKYYKLVLFYKMVNGTAPEYLSVLIPPRTQTVAGRCLRNSQNIRQLKLRTVRFETSFIPSTIKLWNDLPDDIKQSPNLSRFKQNLKLLMFEDKPKPYYAFGQRFPNICHTQLRLGHSCLRSHLFKVNILPDPACVCGNDIESSEHYFLDCNQYADPRSKLFQVVTLIVAPGANPSLLPQLDRQYFVKVLLEGSPDLDTESNENIFKAVHTFINESRRFVF